MSSDLLPFLFVIASTALVLGIAVTVRGLYGFVSDATPRLPAPSVGGQRPDAAGSSTPDPAGSAPAAAPAAVGPRDLREPLILTIAGIFIAAASLIALATLIHSA
jgi:hypothetical protein